MTNGFVEGSIGVIGGGYVGLVSGTCFASLGFNVTVVEAQPAKLELLRQGKSPIYEPGLSELMHDGIAAERLNFVQSTAELFGKNQVEVVLIAVGTPERADGSCNLDYVFDAVRSVVEASKPNQELVIVIKSTVPIGTARAVLKSIEGKGGNRRIAVVNNPEFLKEGAAIADFLRPERVVLGGTETWAIDKVKALYESLLNNGHPLFVTEHETAELAKLASNLMLASRISLINQVSRLSSKVGANVRQVEAIMRSDSRIGSKYLYSGLGYGGSCFPKDVKSFIHQCESAGVDASMAKAVDVFNDSQKLFFMDEIRRRFPKPAQATIALLGTAFKPNTDDIRESPALLLTTELRRLGYGVKAFDPRASSNYAGWLRSSGITGVEVCANMADALTGADAMVLVTEWQEFQHLSPVRLKSVFKGSVIFDGKNTLKFEAFRAAGYDYVGVGRG